jgi:hypothetical protein
MNAREYITNSILKLNPQADTKKIEKMLSAYTTQEIERVADGIERFGLEEILTVFNGKK